MKNLPVGRRIQNARKKAGFSQASLAIVMQELAIPEERGVTRSLIAQIEAGNSNPSLDFLRNFVSICNTSYNHIIDGKEDESRSRFRAGSVLNDVTRLEKHYTQRFCEGLELEEGLDLGKQGDLLKENTFSSEQMINVKDEVCPTEITLNHQLKASIIFVSVSEQASYPVNCHKKEYVKGLLSFALPGFNNCISRAFEVGRDSMSQVEGDGLCPGDIVIGEFVEDHMQVYDNRVYVVVTDKSVVISRCMNRLDAGKLICNFDNVNGTYPPAVIESHQIREMWEFRAKISKQVSGGNQLFDKMTKLKAQFSLMIEEINELKVFKDKLLHGEQ